MGTQRKLSHRFFQYQVIITKFQNLKIIWTPGSHLAFPDILSKNITVEEYQEHQLQHKRIPRDIEFFDEHDSSVSYHIKHEYNPNDTCNDFYPKKYKQGNEEKILRLQNDGEFFTVNTVLNEFPFNSVQRVSDCFRMGRFINQFRRICGPKTATSISANAYNKDFSSTNSLSSAEDDEANQDSHYDDSFHTSIDSEDDNIICDIFIQADRPRLCPAKHAHELVLGKLDASLVKNELHSLTLLI